MNLSERETGMGTGTQPYSRHHGAGLVGGDIESPWLSLSPLTVLPCSPVEQIEAAAHAGFDAVGLRVVPAMPTDIDVMTDASLQRQIRGRIRTTGLQVLDIEVVRLRPDLDTAALEPVLEFAGSLGATWLATTSGTQDEHAAGD